MLIVAMTLPLSLTGCKKTDSAGDADKPAVQVTAIHPTMGPLTEEITADAVLAPLAQAAIQPKITAPVKAFYVQRGSRVHAGQLLARLENRDLAAAALDSQGGYTAAQGTYVTATKQQVPQEVTQARVDLQQAEATLHLDESILKARKDLLQQGAISGRDVDTTQSTVVQAQAAYQIAKEHFDQLTSIGREASLKTAEGQLTSAKGKYLSAEAQLAYTEIRSPIDGVVTDRPLFAGETAAAGSPLVTVMETTALIAKLHLAQRQAQQLAVGAPATLTIAGAEAPVEAKVSLISPALDPGSTTVEVWLRVLNPGGRLRVGTTVQATIQGRTLQKALQVPAAAIQRSAESGGPVVMVVGSDGAIHRKSVVLGLQTAEAVQIVSGLAPGDSVVTDGGYGLDDGTKVKVGAPSEKAAEGDEP